MKSWADYNSVAATKGVDYNLSAPEVVAEALVEYLVSFEVFLYPIQIRVGF